MDKMELLRQISPNVRVALNHRGKGMVIKKRIIFDYELLYLEKGKLAGSIEEKKFILLPGQIVLFKPGKAHSFISEGEEEAWMPHIHFDILNYEDFNKMKTNFKAADQCSREELDLIRPDLLGEDGLGIPDIINIKNHKDILISLKSIIYYFERKDPVTTLSQKSLAVKILYDILKGLEVSGSETFRHSDALDKAVSHIVKHYSENIKVEDLARMSCLSIHHFERLFKRRYGLAPAKYIIRHRMEKAKQIMMYTSMSLSEIARRVGYESIHSFSKAFKKYEGISPSEYVLFM